MKKRFLAALATGLLVVGMGGLAQADPIKNTLDAAHFEDVFVDTNNDKIADTWKTYALYQNSGDLMFIKPENNLGSYEQLLAVETAVEDWLLAAGILDDTAIDWRINFIFQSTSNISYSNPGGTSGTWNVTSPVGGVINFYAVKAGDFYGMYFVEPAEGTGSWSTYDLWVEKDKGNSLNLSHFTGYNLSSTPVPEPATMLLFGTGLAGLAAVARRRRN